MGSENMLRPGDCCPECGYGTLELNFMDLECDSCDFEWDPSKDYFEWKDRMDDLIEEEYGESGGMPEGCAACGGDWPNCDDGSCPGGLNGND